jgi:hypothetical protein
MSYLRSISSLIVYGSAPEVLSKTDSWMMTMSAHQWGVVVAGGFKDVTIIKVL